MPIVSIVLPTYNREQFLPAAIDSIRQQICDDWELIVVDDGSIDDTLRVLQALTEDMSGRITVIRQENMGPGVARNKGILAARGKYVAFYDSDDTWDSGHLSSCIDQLERNPDVDWIYANFRRVKFRTQEVIDQDEFHRNGVPAAFLKLNREVRGALHILRDASAMQCLIEHGLGIGLRASVVRRQIFDRVVFSNSRIGEDQVLYIRAYSSGARFGYLTSVQATAYVHESNISDVSGQRTLEKSIAVSKSLLESLRSLKDLPLSLRERMSLNRRIAGICFWNIGYQYASAKDYAAAIQFMGQGLMVCPQNASFWKTYMVTVGRLFIGRVAERSVKNQM